MATHSSFLAWEIPWTEEPGGLQSMGVTRSCTAAAVPGKQHKMTETENKENKKMKRSSQEIKYSNMSNT